MSVFKRTSFVLKPKAMWPKPDVFDQAKPMTICKATETPLRAIAGPADQPDACYTVCVPTDTYEQNASVYTSAPLNYTVIEKPEQTCRALMQKGPRYTPSVVTESQVETDTTIGGELGLSEDTKMTYFATHFKSGDDMFQIERLKADTGDLARGNDPGK